MITYRIVPSQAKIIERLTLNGLTTGVFHEEVNTFAIKENSDCPSTPFDSEYMKNRYGFPLSNEELHIHTAHKQIWSRFYETDADSCLIMEENVSLSQEIPLIKREIECFSEEWDVFFPFDKTNASNQNKEYLLGYYWGSCVYFLSKKGAKKLLLHNTIKQPVDDELLELGLRDKLNLFYESTPWFNIDFQESYAHVGRLKEVTKKVEEYKAWTPNQKNLVQNILAIIAELAIKSNIKLLLHGGTLLGYVQHGEIIPWDDDVDLGIEEDEFDLFRCAIEADKRLQIMSKIEERTGIEFFKIWSEKGESIENYTYKFPFIDLWLYKRKAQDVIFNNGLSFPNALEKEFQKILFEGSHFYIPHNSLECLDGLYKEWRHKFVIYSWSHRLECVNSKYFKTGIETDGNGKFLKYLIF
ncbi:hypothetical protein AAKU52_003391 [Pedobacter sp. CG_S7]|uniref:LicD family protein n=1 Tax=Pedobacter sp. CG_S7 TaxID=3143930 RepID=UPI0033978DCF